MDSSTESAPENLTLRPDASTPPGYRLVSRLGRGGLGEVWKAEGPGGFQVALKFIALDGGAAVQTRSMELLKRVRHPNLLSPFGAWHLGNSLIIGLELADGTLWDHLRQAKGRQLPGIPREELLEYMAEAAKGIDYLNARRHDLGDGTPAGIQHRDVKPQNILLVGDGVKVADFGLARLLENTRTSHTGSLTVAYAAPEFFRSKTSDRSDQYSLAVTYCMLRGGRLPFQGNHAAMVGGHLFSPPDLTMLPEGERPTVGRALAKQPEERWVSCRAFVEALRLGLSAEVPTADEPSTVAEPSDTAHSKVPPTQDPSGRYLTTDPIGPPRAKIASLPSDSLLPPIRRGQGWPIALGAASVLVVASVLGLALWASGFLDDPARPGARAPEVDPVPGSREVRGGGSGKVPERFEREEPGPQGGGKLTSPPPPAPLHRSGLSDRTSDAIPGLDP